MPAIETLPPLPVGSISMDELTAVLTKKNAKPEDVEAFLDAQAQRPLLAEPVAEAAPEAPVAAATDQKEG